MVGYGSRGTAGFVIRLLNAIVCTALAIRFQHGLSARHSLLHVLSIDRAEAPVLVLASPSQLALNLLDFCSIVWSHCWCTGKNYEQHVNQRIRRDIHQLTVHCASLAERVDDPIDIWVVAIRLPDGSPYPRMKVFKYQSSRNQKAGRGCRDMGTAAIRAAPRRGVEADRNTSEWTLIMLSRPSFGLYRQCVTMYTHRETKRMDGRDCPGCCTGKQPEPFCA